MRRHSLSALAIALLAVAPASAFVHLMVVEEVFVGTPEEAFDPALAPDQRTQYVMLRMTASFETGTAGTFVRVEDKDGNVLGRFGTFAGNQPNGGAFTCAYPACPAIVIGTQAADDLFTFAFDQVVDGEAGRVALPREGGRACFMGEGVVYDCVAWGSFDCTVAGDCGGPNTLRAGDFAGNVCDADFGPPASSLAFGRVLDRTVFNCADKRNGSDFALAFPRPQNNAGTNNNADADADGLIDVLDCNDASGTERWAATAVQNLAVTHVPASSGADLAWTALDPLLHGTGVRYDVPRGSLADLPAFALATCHDANTTVAASSDADVPPAENGFYYDVRGGATAGCVGPYGPGRDALAGACP